jgi:hypothetical protein
MRRTDGFEQQFRRLRGGSRGGGRVDADEANETLLRAPFDDRVERERSLSARRPLRRFEDLTCVASNPISNSSKA